MEEKLEKPTEGLSPITLGELREYLEQEYQTAYKFQKPAISWLYQNLGYFFPSTDDAAQMSKDQRKSLYYFLQDTYDNIQERIKTEDFPTYPGDMDVTLLESLYDDLSFYRRTLEKTKLKAEFEVSEGLTPDQTIEKDWARKKRTWEHHGIGKKRKEPNGYRFPRTRKKALDILTKTHEQIGKYWFLAEKSPEIYEPKLLKCLLKVKRRQVDLGMKKEVRDSEREIIQVRRSLAERDPATYLPELAEALYYLGYFGEGKYGSRTLEYLNIMSEGVAKYRELAIKNPGKYLDDFRQKVTSLERAVPCSKSEMEGYKDVLLLVKPYKNDLVNITKALVEEYRRLAVQDPGQFNSLLAVTLRKLKVCFREVSNREEEERVAYQAGEIYRLVFKGNPEGFHLEFESFLSDFGFYVCFSKLDPAGDYSRLVISLMEDFESFLRLYPDKYSEKFSDCFKKHAKLLRRMGSEKEAAKVEEELLKLGKKTT